MRVAVINSTQPKHPHAGHAWVRATLLAIDALASEHHEFVASLGTAPWELALWRIARVGAAARVICPLSPGLSEQEARAWVLREFGLSEGQCSFQFLAGRRAGRLKDTWQRRDELVLQTSDRIHPVCIRPGGRFERVLREDTLAKRVDPRFRIPFEKKSARQPWRLPAELRLPDCRRMLLHFTRASDGPWPGESRGEFLAAVASSERYPRDGFATLRRIVSERRIRASRFRIRAGGEAVSWTGLEPAGALSLVRWRSRYARFSFEPYAIGLCWEAAVAAGARAVDYDEGATRSCKADSMHQGRGDGGHWEAEQEWRMPGDLDLSGFEPGDVTVFTATEPEAAELRCACPFQVRAFGCSQGA